MIEPPAIKPEERLTPLWILFFFPKQRPLLLGPFSQPNKSSAHGIKKLLADTSPEVAEHVAEFLAIVLRERAQTRYIKK